MAEKTNSLVPRRKWNFKDPLAIRVFVSELFGTTFLVVVLTSISCQAVLSRGQTGNAITTYLGTIFGITFAIYVSFKGSGAHINPIVTTALVFAGQMQKRLLLVYWAAQYIGAFLGVAMAYGVYSDAFRVFDGGNRTLFGELGTGAIFSSFPQNENTSILTCIFDQLLSTSLLIVGLLSIIDQPNMQIPPLLMPPVAGMLIGSLLAAFGHNCNAPLNPAKDFSSRIFMSIAGWGVEPFSHRSYCWFYIPLIVPHIGALIGALVYRIYAKVVLVQSRIKADEEEDEDVEDQIKLPKPSDTVLTKLLEDEKVTLT